MTDAKYRVSNWLDTNTMKPKYGIQRRIEPRKWANMAHNGEAVLFDTQDEAKALIRSLSNKGKGDE